MSLDDETSKKVIRQVEFYFSDSNLPRDTFLKKTISESEDGMVSLPLICSFARMRGHLGLGDVKPDDIPEENIKAVAETLRSSDFLKISDDGQKVGRRTELAKPEEVIEQVDNRTIAASPLPYDVKLEDVESFFAQSAKVNSVRLPRHVYDKRLFCGTALVEFSTEEDAQNVLKQSIVYAGADLELKPKKDFDAGREKQEIEFEKSRVDSSAKGSASEDAGSYPKGLIVAFTLKSMASGNALKQDSSVEPTNEAVEASKTIEEESAVVASEEADKEQNKVVGEDENSGAEGETDKASGDKSAVAGKDEKDVVSREDLKAVFKDFGNIKYVDFTIGLESGYLRFEDAEAGQKARAAAVLSEQGGIVVKNSIAILEPVTGEAEKEYWSQIRDGRDRFQGKGNRGRGGKHHRGGKRGHYRESGSSGGRSNKVQKIAA